MRDRAEYIFFYIRLPPSLSKLGIDCGAISGGDLLGGEGVDGGDGFLEGA